MRFILTIILFTCWQSLYAQPCTILSSANKICVGGSIAFTRTPASASDSAFAWNFGDGNSSTQSSPTYQYQTSGTFTVTLRIHRFGGTFCDATPLQIRVFPKPLANFNITSNDTQCFRNNLFTVVDLSQPGPSNAPLRRRTVLWGDGTLIQSNAPFPSIQPHSYTDPAGDLYKLVIEVEDTNGCLNQKIDSVVVYKRVDADFTVIQDIRCNSTHATFRNLSNMNFQGAKMHWYWDDGLSALVNYSPNDTVYVYKGNREFIPKLVAIDRFGCKDSFISPIPVVTFIPDSTIIITPIDKRCFSGNKFAFKNNTQFGFTKWTLSKPEISYLRDTILTKTWDTIVFPSCGIFNVKLEYTFNSCTFVTDTQVVVYGPQANIESKTQAPLNWIQCGTHDTVVFRQPDVNCYYGNTSAMKYFWDFRDPFAPACTTDTKRGINVGVNCRYSKDSSLVKHFYSQPNQTCYKVKMWVADTIRNCADTDYVDLRLGSPDAGWDSTANPIRYGAYVKTANCTDDILEVVFDQLLPLCGPENVWFTPDTSCPTVSWIKVDSIGREKKYKFSFNSICTTDSIVYFGIVARNGKDALGNFCYDTAYYSYKVKRPPYLQFKMEWADSNICAPHRFKIYTTDSIRKDIQSITFNFNDNTTNLTIPFNNPSDTIIPTIYHNFMRDGEFKPIIFIQGKNGCTSSNSFHILTGKKAIAINNTPNICDNTEAEFQAFITYNSNPLIPFWESQTRSDAGKEQIFWDFGDGTPWTKGLQNIKHKYTQPGTYPVRLAFKDSTNFGCFDTAYLTTPVTVSAVKAKIFTASDTFYCAPSIVSYIDSSYSFVNSNIPDYSLIISRKWFFTNNRTSTLENPGIFYPANGVYPAVLYSESVLGCSDWDTTNIVIKGPEPSFVIMQDTFGCAPFTVKLDNTTNGNVRNWIWYFNDNAGTIYSTSQDTNVTFTYTQPGIYQIDLVGEADVYNPTTGSTQNCSQKFPYVNPLDNYHSRTILVLASDTLKIVSKDSICPDAVFEALANNTNRTDSVKWYWGDGDSALAKLNVNTTHSYDTIGVYLLKVEPVFGATKGCVLGAEKNIYVTTPVADFDFNASQFPLFRFNNLSQGAVRYVWDFGQPSSPNNSSTEENPQHDYGNANEEFVVCLMAFDANDCMDSVCKPMLRRSRVEIPNVFTPDNADDKNDAFDIDIEGYEKYELFIYNRWGTLVYESKTDGYRNDGINWNGKNFNTGEECPEGTYFVIFKYKLLTSPNEEVYRGTVTLIRNLK